MGTKEIYLPSSARTGGIALPKRVENEVVREQSQIANEVEHISERLNYYNYELQQIDRDLHVIMAKPHTTIEGLKPGYYHLVRAIPGVGTYIEPYENEDGSWRDLDSGIFKLAEEADTWNDRTQKEIRRVQKKVREAKERQHIREKQERAAEIDARLWHINNVSVSIPRALKK